MDPVCQLQPELYEKVYFCSLFSYGYELSTESPLGPRGLLEIRPPGFSVG